MNKMRILVVDDNQDIRKSMKALLEGAFSTSVTAATSPEEALKKNLNGFDVIIVDFNLKASMDGIELIREIRTQGIEAVIILMSSSEVGYKAGRAGADAFHSKATRSTKLLDLIEKLTA